MAVVLEKPHLAPPPVPDTVVDGFPCRKLELSGHVGIDSLPEQYVAHARRQGFTFNLLCVGETGIGKSTLMESLFNMNLSLEPCSHELRTIELRESAYDIEESSVRLKLSIVETAGFGDMLDKDSSANIIVEYVNRQFESYLQEEMKVKRCLQFYKDTRIHVCLYFISPTGHGLKALDVCVLKLIAGRVNVIPVIAKSDTISKEELKRFKGKIRSDLEHHQIKVYKFPEDDSSVANINQGLNAASPFAVVGSTDFVQKGGKKVRARTYPWGMVEVENEEHCDFIKLREALLRTNVEDLRERTHTVLYEEFRRERLREMGFKEGDLGVRLREAFEKRRVEHQARMQQREADLRNSFLKRVQEKENELKAQEQKLQKLRDDEKAKYDAELRGIQAEERQLDQEMAEFERRKEAYLVKSATGKFDKSSTGKFDKKSKK